MPLRVLSNPWKSENQQSRRLRRQRRTRLARLEQLEDRRVLAVIDDMGTNVEVPGLYALYEGGYDFFSEPPELAAIDLQLSATVSEVSETPESPAVYIWDIDPNPTGIPQYLEGGAENPAFVADFLDPLGATPIVGLTAEVPWSELVARGITTGTPFGKEAIISLKVIDLTGITIRSAALSVFDLPFELASSIELTPTESGCEPAAQLSFSVTDRNPQEVITALVNWDTDDPESVEESIPLTLDGVEEGIATFSLSTTHVYATAGLKNVSIRVVADPIDFDNDTIIDLYAEELVTGGSISVTGGAGTPAADIEGAPTNSVPYKPISLTNAAGIACGVDYVWSVSKNGLPFAGPISDPGLSLTPDGPGTYVVTLTASNGSDPDATDTVTIHVVPVVLAGGELLVGGTAGDDLFLFTPTATPGEYTVRINGVNRGTFAPTGSVRVFGGPGTADEITVRGDENTNAFAIHSDRLEHETLAFYADGVETRRIEARGSGDTVSYYSGSATVSGGSGADTLIAATGGDNAWSITGANSGSLNGLVTFTSIERLVGGAGGDTFTFGAGGRIGQSIDGAGGTNALDLSAQTDNKTWNLTSATAGTVDGLAFSGMTSLVGGLGSDVFRVTEGVTFTGSVAGGGGADRLDYAAYLSAVEVDLATGTATGFGAVSGIENATGGAGDDLLTGDSADNVLLGGGGNDILRGGAGNDTLRGGAGRDLMIGGTGADVLQGNTEEDILIAGTTAYDAHLAALVALLAVWNDTSAYPTYAARVAAVSSGAGTGGLYWLSGDDGPGQTVFNDADVDTLTGNAGRDWFFANRVADDLQPLDIVTDLGTNEIWSDTDE